MEIVNKDSYLALDDNGREAGRIEYQTGDNEFEITHTEVSPGYEGKGLGKQLVEAAVSLAREKDLKVKPSCSYAAKVISRDSSMQH